MDSFDIYRCLRAGCNRLYVSVPGLRICCPRCFSKERAQTGQILDPREFVEILLNCDNVAVEAMRDTLESLTEVHGRAAAEANDHPWLPEPFVRTQVCQRCPASKRSYF